MIELFFMKLGFNEGDTFKSSSMLIYQNAKHNMYGLMSHVIKGKLRQGELLNVKINLVGCIFKAMQRAQKATGDRTFCIQFGLNEGDTFKSSSILIY